MQSGIERVEAAQELQIPILLQRRMQAADHVYLGYSKGECFRNGSDDFVTRIFKGMDVSLLGGEGTELAGEYTDVGIVDVTVVDIGRVVAVLSLPHGARHHSQCVEIRRTIEKERVFVGNALPR